MIVKGFKLKKQKIRVMKIGSKVICIVHPSVWSNRDFVVNFPEKDKTYTIREFSYDGDNTYIRFEEIINPLATDNNGNTDEPDFNISGFRKVEKQDNTLSLELAEEGIDRINRESEVEKITVPQIERVFSLTEDF